MKVKFSAPLFLLLAAPVFAQSAAGLAGISGVVRDPSGALIPNAKVVISSESQGTLRSLSTNTDGVFTAPALTPGAGYRVSVAASGFTAYEAKDLTLLVGQNLDLQHQPDRGPGRHAGRRHRRGAAGGRHQDRRVAGGRRPADSSNLPINGRRVDTLRAADAGRHQRRQLRPAHLPRRGRPELLPGGRQRHHRAVLQRERRPHTHRLADFAGRRAGIPGGLLELLGRVWPRHGRRGQHRHQERRQPDSTAAAYWFFRRPDFNARDRSPPSSPPEKRNQLGGTRGRAPSRRTSCSTS